MKTVTQAQLHKSSDVVLLRRFVAAERLVKKRGGGGRLRDRFVETARYRLRYLRRRVR